MRRIAVPLALLAASVLAPGAGAAPPLGRVVLRGSSHVAADVDVPAGTVPTDLRVTTRGSYAVLVLSDARTGAVKELAMFVRDVEPAEVLGPSRTRPLPAGRYRVTLLTDGPSEVSVGLGPLATTRVLTPTRRVAAGAAGRALSPVGEVRVPFTATGREHVIFAIRSSADTVNVDHLEMCATRPARSCSDADETYFSTGPDVDTGSRTTVHGMVTLSRLRQGERYDFLEQYVGAGTTAHGFAVVATL